MKIKSMAISALAIALAGCGSAAASSQPLSAKALAARIGCTGVGYPTASVYARQDVTCSMLSQTSGDGTSTVQVQIVTFTSASAETHWLTDPQSYEGGIFIQGRLWAVDVNGMEPDSQYIRGKIGGREVEPNFGN